MGEETETGIGDVRDSVADGAALWQGRFAAGPAPEMMELSRSLAFDRVLWHWDIVATRAHVRMLGAQGIIPAEDVESIVAALATVHHEMETGAFEFEASDEDIHTALERRVSQLAGDAGRRIHTGRSRNDQVATALRLWVREHTTLIATSLLRLIDALEARAREADESVPAIALPGYTHLQQAQPVLLSHHLRAHCFALARDAERLCDARDRANISPLGAGALAGSSLPLDPWATAAELGFTAPFANSLDAVSDRDFVAEVLFVLSLLGVHLSRIGEEWVLWTTAEFGYAVLDDSVATGSSMLPQKKNADIAELSRGKAGRLVGNLTGLLTTLKGLPLSYNRDLQEDKEPLFDSVSQVSLLLPALTVMVERTRFVPSAMTSSADNEAMAATDLAEWLVEKGTPFRDAHTIVGQVVREALETGRPLRDVVADHPKLGPGASELCAPGVALARRSSPGGGGPAAAPAQRERLAAVLTALRTRVTR